MKNLVLEKVYKLKELWDNSLIPFPKEHEVNPNLDKDDRLNYIYFTLPCCINYQRNSINMWQSVLNTFNDKETNYLFYPERVVKTEFNKIQNDLVKHKLALQRNKHTEIWIKISEAFYNNYNSDPRELLIKECDGDVLKILNIITKSKKDIFPHLRGPKLSNYWLMILSFYTSIKLKNKEYISIIPDTHIMQASVKLGLVEEDCTNQLKVSEAWFNLLSNQKVTPVEMHPILWNWSRNNFKPEV